MQKISEVIVQSLKSAGIRDVFGIPSIHNIGLYEALRKDTGIRHILCRHESSAMHMADGYARSGKGLGVAIASTGPGTTYTLSPLMEAWWSCSPILLITSNIPSDQIGQGLGVLHELDEQDALFRHLTKERIRLRATDDAAAAVQEMIRTSVSGRPGPVYLEVPVDVWDKPALTSTDATFERDHPRSLPDLREAIHLLRKARFPIIVTGIEAVRAGLAGVVTGLAETLGAPVLTDFSGKGVVPEDHALGFGSAVQKGIVREMYQSCDAVLAVGSRLRRVDFFRKGIRFPGLIHVDWDETWINKNHPADLTLIGDVQQIAASLLEELKKEPLERKQQQAVEAFRRSLNLEVAATADAEPEARYLRAIRRAIPRNGSLVVDNTVLGYLAEPLYPSYRPGGIVTAKGATPIGFSLPAAIGLKVADPARPVVALVGDGGFLYGAQELATCVRHGIGLPILVINDSAYRMIDFLQQRSYQKGYESDLTNPDFVAFAQSFGISALRVNSPDGLGEALAEALASGELRLIEVRTTFPSPPFMKY